MLNAQKVKGLAATTAIVASLASSATAAPSDSSEAAAKRFVEKYVAAWAAHDAAGLAALWDPTGQLIDPLYDRPLRGSEIAALTQGQLSRNPDLKWTLVRWTAHGDSIAMEFRNDFTVAGKPFEWQGVDWMTIANGRIVEERVYVDTAKLRAAATGAPLEPVVRIPPASDGGR